ncbi:MAG: hypothetical protein MUO77_00925 [Anaerolineales bacterium]|nr:hypothetical protein [Anaerolineales bacterium]
MSDEPNKDSRSRFRSLISSGQDKALAPEADGSPLARLPKGRAKPVQLETPSDKPSLVAPASTRTPSKSVARLGSLKFGPAFWTIASVLSLTINVVLIIVLLLLVPRVLQLNIDLNKFTKINPVELVGGLYTNFEKMDRASIVTNIPVDAQIPLSINVPVQTTTEITLVQDAVISGARVRINTNTLDIDAPANVTLPAGTRLTVGLNFSLQVQDNIPIHVDVPVNIPLAQTDLHVPFAGLQDVVKPLYCLVAPAALNLSGAPVCP